MKKCFLFVILSFIFSITYAQENSINCEVARQKYLQQNPDVSNVGFDPWDHYNRHGKKEGRIWPSCDNEINCEVAHQKYLEQNPDVANAGLDPWVHYNRHGKKEGRIWPSCDNEINCEVARQKYLKQNPDVANAGFDPWVHYNRHGKKEARIWPSCDNERKASVENNKTNSQISHAKLDNTVTGLNPSNRTNYSTVLINGKDWMTQNLDLTTFRNGDIIPQAKTEQDLIDANKNQTPIWCYFDFNPATETNYGKLYNWYALNDPRGLMPIGFVIPSVQDCQTLNNLSYFKNTNGRAELYISETKEIHGGKIKRNFSFNFENGPFKEKKYDRVFGVPEDEIGYYWTTGTFQDRYNDRINVYYINSNGRVGIDEYEHKGACVSVRGIKADHNYYSGNWVGNIKSGNGTEFYGINTTLKGFGIVHKGDKYTGNWVNGVQDGEGSIILTNGEIKTGLWKNGEFKGEWKYVDNRHKCYQCNTNVCKSIKRTSAEIENYKKNAYSIEVGIYNTQSYCSSTCEAKAIAIQKAREKQYERENQNNLTKQQTSNTYNSNQGRSWHPCEYCTKSFDKPYLNNCKVTNRPETRPGYVLCSQCHGYGYQTTMSNCSCDGWCYEKKCYVTGCEGGWVMCGECRGKAQRFW